MTDGAPVTEAPPATAPPTIAWFRDDLRVTDNPALTAAAERGAPVMALYVLDEQTPGIRPLGGAARWWLHHSLLSLRRSLDGLGIPLVLRRGAAEAVVRELASATGAGAVVWNRRYGAAERDTDARLKAGLREAGVAVQSFGASLLFEPWAITTGSGTPYSVFTPFWRACLAAPEPRHPLAAPRAMTGFSPPPSDDLDDWALLPTAPDWAAGLREHWAPGEESADALLGAFLDESLGDYAELRDVPARPVTSRLSPHLRWGEISPHQVWHATTDARRGADPKRANGATKFLSELGWREFAAHVSFAAPDLATTNWRPEFEAFPWPPLDERALAAWQRGNTGVPLVDAGMRELWATGTMHNRVRMVVASYLTKNLLIDWRHGEQWFWRTLVDADPASNPFNWQWVAGSGADAAPYFRVFNPLLQASKFDARGEYIARWVPEWGTDEYPQPIVDLAVSRRAALAAYAAVRHPL